MSSMIKRLGHISGAAMPESDVRALNPLVLAYLGDTIYDLLIRTWLVGKHRTNVNRLHRMAVGFVNAGAQASALKRIEEKLTDEERDVVRRGRNAKSNTIPKNAEVLEYRWATGLEALLGFLYLTGREVRLLEIREYILEAKNDCFGEG